MAQSGFITLHRKLLQSSVFEDAELLKVWIWCLLRANHKDCEVVHAKQIVPLKRGEFITGRFSASEELFLSEKVFRNRIETLVRLGQIAKKRANKFSIISVVKYDYYQTNVENRANKGPTKGQQRATDNNVNNVNNKGEPSSQLENNQNDMAWQAKHSDDDSDLPVVGEDGSIKKEQPKVKRTYPEVYKLFDEVLERCPANWIVNTTQQKCAENLYTERGLKAIKTALLFYKANKDKEFCPQINSPSDLDAKWTKLATFKTKHGN